MSLIPKIRKGLQNPKLAFRNVRGLIIGFYYKIKYRILLKQVLFGKNFQVYAKIIISGPGKIIFGDNAEIFGHKTFPVTLYTHDKNAIIDIGDNVRLVSTRISCRENVIIGSDSILSDARITDTDFHHIAFESRHKSVPITKPVILSNNVWIGAAAHILKGVTIGENSVVGANAVVTKEVPPNVVVAGNPAKIIKEIA